MKLDIGSKCGAPLIRDVIACYIAGYKAVEISSDQLTAMQKRDLHTVVNKLIGPEILEETINKVVIHDLLSEEELPADRALKRMKNVVRSMIHDALSSLIKRNKELAMDVIQRDDDVDRLNLLIARQFNDILRSGSINVETHSPISAFNYMQAATNLERMADHASKIAEISSQIDFDLPAEIAEYLSRLGLVFANLMDDCISVLLNPDTDKANQLIDKTQEIKTQSLIMTRSFWEKCNGEMLIR
ncbi:MAG: phosphate uptake regulator PhoU, partial [Methanothrix sp.]|nr:phosphate uptake regulator PhoU [Methanothrix sp.]